MNALQRWRLRRDLHLSLRPPCSDDAAALGALIDGLPPRDRLMRFHGAVNGLAAATLRRWTEPDAPRETAFVACARDGRGTRLVADTRYVIDATGDAAELALVVAAGWRRLGIGECCLHALRGAAFRAGLRWLYGSVRADNAPMLALARRCGFVIARNRAARGLMVVELRVDVPPPFPGGDRRRGVVWPLLRRIGCPVACP